MILFLFRHGQTDWNLARRIQGQTDIPLNETGREQARTAAGFAPQLSPDAVYSSTLSRARETAAIMAGACGIATVHTLESLRERNFGPFEGGDLQAWYERFPGPEGAFSGLESFEELQARSVGALGELERLEGNRRVLCVAHGAVIDSLLRYCKGEAWGGLGSIHLKNCSLSVFNVASGDRAVGDRLVGDRARGDRPVGVEAEGLRIGLLCENIAPEEIPSLSL